MNLDPTHPPLTAGAHHVGLTVPDLTQAVAFFTEVLGLSLVKERPDYPAAFVSDGALLITLWQAQVDDPTKFDRRKNLGLHHLALELHPDADLDAIETVLTQRRDVEIEFSPQPLGQGPARHMMCTVASAFRLELVG